MGWGGARNEQALSLADSGKGRKRDGPDLMSSSAKCLTQMGPTPPLSVPLSVPRSRESRIIKLARVAEPRGLPCKTRTDRESVIFVRWHRATACCSDASHCAQSKAQISPQALKRRGSAVPLMHAMPRFYFLVALSSQCNCAVNPVSLRFNSSVLACLLVRTAPEVYASYKCFVRYRRRLT